MSNHSRSNIERALTLFGVLIQADPALRREFEDSRAEFRAGVPQPAARGTDVARLAERRHLEWYLLERHSEHLEGMPAEALREAWEERAEEQDRAVVEVCLGSRAGVYEITGVTEGSGLWLRDLSTRGEYPVEEPEAAAGLEVGDLIVGRLFPLGTQAYGISPAAGCFRGKSLHKALTRDLEAARGARRGNPRISQQELERMFFSGGAGDAGGESFATPVPEADPSPSRVLEAAGGWLAASGVSEQRAQAIVASLVASPLREECAVPGIDDPLARALEELAFDSPVDLEEARRVLLEAWTAASEARGESGPKPDSAGPVRRASAPATGASTEPVGAEGALAEFDRGRTAGADLGALFDQLELSLGLELDGDEERLSAEIDPAAETDGSPAPDFPGVMGAMVEEFLWDAERREGVDERRGILRLIGPFAEQVPGLGVFENLTARDLALFLSSWVIERGAVTQGADARALVDAAQGFCVWADENHELNLAREFEPMAEELRSSLPRLVEANLVLGKVQAAEGEPLMGEVVVEDGEVLADAGGDRRRLELPLTAIGHLRTGDLAKLRGRAGTWEPDRFFPALAADFLRG